MRLLYYKHPALVKPSLPALKPLRSLQPRHVLRPSGKNSPYVQKLRALPVQGVTSVMKMAPSSGKRMACAPHCFSLPTGCTRLLWPRLKAHLPASSPPPSRFSRLYTIPCRYSPWHKAETHRLDNRTGLAARPSRGRGISEVTARSCGNSPSPFWKLLYEWFSCIAGCVPSCLFTYCPLEAGDISINDPGCSAC